MNKTAIKNFAVWARQKLISDITYKASMLGITKEGIADKLPQSTNDLHFYDIGTKDYVEISGKEIAQRSALVSAIKQKEKDVQNYTDAFQYIVEEVAYTWFNRLVAIRFMEVNDYLPSGVRVLSSENKAKKEPDLVTTPFDTDLEFTSSEQDKIIQLKDDNELDELFRILFIKQCNKLHDILPDLFEKTDDYSELLLTIPFTDPDGIIYHLVNDIEEVDFRINDEMYTDDGKIKADGQVEIIGWLYQYYISKKHEEVVNPLYGKAIKKQDIPAATQLFTTDWIVRYMVDNSLGRYWIERNPKSKLAEKLEFFVTPKNGEIQYIDEKVNPTDLTFFDPCMGSGHILVYAFDVLMEIYREVGYSDRDAALSIVENNLFGMDIDKRAYQLAYFAVMMKARSYNRRALTKGISNNLAVVEESNSIDKFACNGLITDSEQNKIGEYLVEAYRDAQEVGTLQTIEKKDYNGFVAYLNNIESSAGQIDIFSTVWLNDTLPQMIQLSKQAEIMSNKYAVVCTNPPYMNKFEGHLKDFLQENFKDYKGDLFSAFIFRNFGYCKKDGYSAFMTPNVWLFIKTYEKLREYILNTKSIVTLVQMAKGAFFKEATVDICSFVLENNGARKSGSYIRLENFKGGMEVQKQKVLEAIDNKDCGYFYEADENNFSKIPGSPIAYWATKAITEVFQNSKLLTEIANPRQGLITGNVNRFVRKWHECSLTNLNLSAKISDPQRIGKWFPYCNGGAYRKWYGNNDSIVNWYNDGEEIRNYPGSAPRSTQYYFREGLSWSTLSSDSISFRYEPKGFTMNTKGSICYLKRADLQNYICGLLNSKPTMRFLELLAPTLDYSQGPVGKVPVLLDAENREKVELCTLENIRLSKEDWDSFETSWNFIIHPLVSMSKGLWDATATAATMDYYYGYLPETSCPLEICYLLWQGQCKERFEKLKANEEELNRIFIDIYGLQDELTPEVEDKDVTVRKADLQRDIKSLLSYAVGCMFGRYSLDVEGLAYAGGKWDSSKYQSYIPDADNVIPITDEEYLDDDIVSRLCAWLKAVYGAETLEANLDYIAKALGNKGSTSREIIRNYFLNDFFKDHCQTYSVTGSGKRPIYWLFDSGKQNGFKALVYLHRYTPDTIGNLRIDYLHKMQRVYESEINRMQDMMDHSGNAREVATASKRKDKLAKQLKECREYDEKISHLALSRIELDLDDGVKVNYRKLQTAQDGKFYEVLADSKNIMVKEKK